MANGTESNYLYCSEGGLRMAFQIYMGTDKRKHLDLHRRENRMVVVVCLFVFPEII